MIGLSKKKSWNFTTVLDIIFNGVRWIDNNSTTIFFSQKRWPLNDAPNKIKNNASEIYSWWNVVYWKLISKVFFHIFKLIFKSVSIVSFIPFFMFGFWLLLATKLQKCKILRELGLLTFCKERWARKKKNEKKNHTIKVTKIPKTKILDNKFYERFSFF